MSPPFAIILVAAGASTRMGFPKLWADLDGQPLLAHAIAAACLAQPTELILVVSTDRVADAQALAPTAFVVPGGARRRDSVAAGLNASTCQWLAIHDAARALAPASLYALGLEAARASGAAIPVVALKDTIKRVDNGRVVETIARADHAAVQTPQVFRRDVLQRALSLTDNDVPDEAALVEQLGVSIATFRGDERALKVTTPLDFLVARALLTPSPFERRGQE